MGRRVRILAAGLGTILLIFGTFAGSDPSIATGDTSACVWTGIGVQGNVTSTTVIETDAGTCPALPPNPDNPCPGGDGNYTQRTVTTLVEVGVMVCVKDLP